MEKNNSALYAAFCAKDSRFDGRFFVGVSSTRIYCRPVCHARMPKEENCTFFASAAEAEQAGYRPCLLCRPEAAPGASRVDAASSLAKRAARFIEENCGNGENLEKLAKRLGCTDRHLRRVFETEYHVSPVQYLQTCRLLLAKNLLADTNLQVTDVALASGFKSLRRFNDAFKEKYRLTPTDLRKRMSKEKRECTNIKVSLGYRPPYLWDEILHFLGQRTIPGVDLVKNGVYYRTVSIRDAKGTFIRGWTAISNNPGKSVLEVTLSEPLLPVLPQVLGRVKNMFDLYCDPEAVSETLHSMNELKKGVLVKGIRLPGCFDPFEMSVRAILGQQITVKAASALSGRVAAAFGETLNTPVEELTHTFPTPERITGLEGLIGDHLGPLGVIRNRAEAILSLAQAIMKGEVCFDQCLDPTEEIRKLQTIKGIGSWTANYIAMRTMAWPDAFLETDIGIKHALPGRTPKELLILSEQWRPWRSYATVSLWNSLESGGNKHE